MVIVLGVVALLPLEDESLSLFEHLLPRSCFLVLASFLGGFYHMIIHMESQIISL